MQMLLLLQLLRHPVAESVLEESFIWIHITLISIDSLYVCPTTFVLNLYLLIREFNKEV